MEPNSDPMDENEADDWKAKYEECEKTLSALKPLAADGVKAYDELLNKYNTNQTQYQNLQEKLKEKEDQLYQMKNLLEPVYNEYDELQTRLSIEAKCREEVESYASKLTKENKVLRRQSQAFLTKTGGLVPVQKEPDTFNEHCQKMNVKIKELEEEMTQLKRQARGFEEDAVTQRERADKAVLRLQKTNRDLEHTKKVLIQHEQALKELANCSEIAYTEYQSLRKKHDVEMLCRNKAEQYASKMFSQTEAMKRQSAILLTTVASDERLLKALVQVEEVNEELENLKQKHEAEVKSLQEQLEGSQQTEKVNTLEEELSRLENDNENLQRKNDEFNTQYAELEEKYRKLENKYETLIAPPPPPPPPLPVDFNVARKNVTQIIKERREKNDKNSTTGGAKLNDGYAKALNEMMDRIKGGQPVLKPSGQNMRRPSAPDVTDTGGNGGEAMKELHNIFSKIKRFRSEGDLLSVTSTSSEDRDQSSELAKAFQKVRGASVSNSDHSDGASLPPLQEERLSQISQMSTL